MPVNTIAMPRARASFGLAIAASLPFQRISPESGERHLRDGEMDFVAMGRQLLADPEIPARLLADRPDLVRTCINCYVCVAQNFWDGTPVCAVNAELGHTDEGPVEPAPVRRHVAVVGGGPGGMEAARVAALRGHRVTLLEKADELGGTARFSSLTTPMNAELVRYLSTSINELDVEVRTGVDASVDHLRSLGVDAVVVATGARRERPAVPGADLPHVLSGDDLRGMLTGEDREARGRLPLQRRAMGAAGRRAGILSDMGRVRAWSKRWMPVGKHVVVVGGGLVGVELAVPYALWTAPAPPAFLGTPFQREDEFEVWALHVWVWRDNPAGLFAESHPLVACEGD